MIVAQKESKFLLNSHFRLGADIKFDLFLSTDPKMMKSQLSVNFHLSQIVDDQSQLEIDLFSQQLLSHLPNTSTLSLLFGT